jgi:hypothetical protein
MATQTVEHLGSDRRKADAPPPAKLRRRDIRPRVVALGESTADLVGFAGGWLFDLAAAGWEVSALVSTRSGDLALRILGARPMDLDTALASEVHTVAPDVLALSVALYRDDAAIRQVVLEILNDGMTNVLLWGNRCPAELDGLVKVIEHRVSAAAQAFKSQAVAMACGGSESAGATEGFWGVDLRRCRAEPQRLVAAV